MNKISHSEDPLLHDILNRIEFRLLREDTPGSLHDSVDLTKGEGFTAFDVANTHIHDEDTKIFDIQFLRTPRLSTIATGYIINQLVKYMPKISVYLNVGVWCGFSYFAGIIGNNEKRCIGVDNFTTPPEIRNIFHHQYPVFQTQNSIFLKWITSIIFVQFIRNKLASIFMTVIIHTKTSIQQWRWLNHI